MGIMQDIRTLLVDGRSTGDVIHMGYNPNTVYKCKRQLGVQGHDSIRAQRLRFLESLLAQVMTLQPQPKNANEGLGIFYCPQCNAHLEYFETLTGNVVTGNGYACPECKQTITI